MPRRWTGWTVLWLAWATVAGFAQGKEPAPPGHHQVEGVELVRRGAGRLDWSVQGDLVAFDAPDEKGRYQIRVMRSDGSEERCLTCRRPELSRAQALNPGWHPSGELIVFQRQKPARRLGLTLVDLVTPDRGLHTTLWAVTADGLRIWPLVTGQTGDFPVLDPYFSHEADLLVWAERVASREGRWGRWGLRVARFEWDGSSRTSRIREHEPVRGLVLPQGFWPDDRGVLVATLPEGATSPALRRFEIAEARLGGSPGLDAAGGTPARVSPGGEWIVWATGRTLPRRTGVRRLPSRNELWRIPVEGGEAERLTYFNDPASSTHLGDALIGDIAWHPEGDRLLLHLILDRPGELEERAVKIVLREPM